MAISDLILEFNNTGQFDKETGMPNHDDTGRCLACGGLNYGHHIGCFEPAKDIKIKKTILILTEFANSQGHSNCWHHPEILKKLCDLWQIPVGDPQLPPRDEFRRECQKYEESIYGQPNFFMENFCCECVYSQGESIKECGWLIAPCEKHIPSYKAINILRKEVLKGIGFKDEELPEFWEK